MKKKALILYGTRKGATHDTSVLIAETLSAHCSHEVEVVNVKDYKTVKKRVSEFDAIIIGSSIVSGRWVGKCLRVLRSLKLENQGLFIFVTAGGTMHKPQKYGIKKSEAIEEGLEKYIHKYIKKYQLSPMSTMVFGGKRIIKNELRYDNWDGDDIKTWAMEIGLLMNNN